MFRGTLGHRLKPGGDGDGDEKHLRRREHYDLVMRTSV